MLGVIKRSAWPALLSIPPLPGTQAESARRRPFLTSLTKQRVEPPPKLCLKPITLLSIASFPMKYALLCSSMVQGGGSGGRMASSDIV